MAPLVIIGSLENALYSTNKQANKQKNILDFIPMAMENN